VRIGQKLTEGQRFLYGSQKRIFSWHCSQCWCIRIGVDSIKELIAVSLLIAASKIVDIGASLSWWASRGAIVVRVTAIRRCTTVWGSSTWWRRSGTTCRLPVVPNILANFFGYEVPESTREERSRSTNTFLLGRAFGGKNRPGVVLFVLFRKIRIASVKVTTVKVIFFFEIGVINCAFSFCYELLQGPCRAGCNQR